MISRKKKSECLTKSVLWGDQKYSYLKSFFFLSFSILRNTKYFLHQKTFKKPLIRLQDKDFIKLN